MIEDSTLDQRYQGLSAMDALKNKIDGSTATNNPNGLSSYIDTYISNMNNRNQELDTIIQTFNSTLLNNNLVGAENIVANTKNCLSNYLSKKSNLVKQLASLKELLEKYDKPLTSSLDSSNQRTDRETAYFRNGSNTVGSSNSKKIESSNAINKYTGNGTLEDFLTQVRDGTYNYNYNRVETDYPRHH